MPEGGEGAARLDTLPVTGLVAPDMRSGPDVSRGQERDVQQFVQSEQGTEVFQEWRKGKLTDRAIGQQYGYGVLGHFYGQRDWELGTYGDDSLPSTLVAEGGSLQDGSPGAAGPCEASEELTDGAAGSADAAAVTADNGEQEGDVASVAAEGMPSSSVLTGSRQTCLSHWLLRDPE